MNQYSFQFGPELIVDLFAGGGGASLGIEQAFGRPVDVCVNHDAEAVQMHMANHPRTQHYCADVFEVDPIEATKGRAVGLLWASPSCTHFSKAKGGKPLDKKIRGLSWVVVAWAKAVRPRVIILENVEEFQTWGPLDDESKPCPRRRGETFNEWLGELRALGYAVEHRELRACDYGAPTIRKRFFLIARCDGRPIVWPKQTHGKPGAIEVIKGRLKPWLTAASCIDWSLVCPSIFERSKPLADATLWFRSLRDQRWLDMGKKFPGPWWQGYQECGEDLEYAQAVGEAPPDWMIEPKKMRDMSHCDVTAKSRFIGLWMGIHGTESWAANPTVQVIEFEQVKP